MKKNQIKTLFFLQCFFMIILFNNCKQNLNREIELNVDLVTGLDLENVDNIVVEKYKNNKLINFSRVKLKFKSVIDSSEFESLNFKYHFKVNYNFYYGYDYRLILNINNDNHKYFIKNIKIDTLYNGSTIYTFTKSYTLNGKKVETPKGGSFYLE